jgi:hypothetical protein
MRTIGNPDSGLPLPHLVRSPMLNLDFLLERDLCPLSGIESAELHDRLSGCSIHVFKQGNIDHTCK